MSELRPHLDARGFLQIVRDMQREGYVLAFLAEDERVLAVAGFRRKSALFCDRVKANIGVQPTVACAVLHCRG